MTGAQLDKPLTDEAGPPRRLHYSAWRIVPALLVALIADTLSLIFSLALPVEWTIDVLAAVSLFVILGARWPLLPALLMEAVPGLAMLPTWLLVVSWIVFAGRTPATRRPPPP